MCEKFSDVWGLASGSLQTSTATPQSQISASSLLLFSVLQSRVVFYVSSAWITFSRRWRSKIKVTLLFLSFVCQNWEIDLEQKDHSAVSHTLCVCVCDLCFPFVYRDGIPILWLGSTCGVIMTFLVASGWAHVDSKKAAVKFRKFEVKQLVWFRYKS